MGGWEGVPPYNTKKDFLSPLIHQHQHQQPSSPKYHAYSSVFANNIVLFYGTLDQFHFRGHVIGYNFFLSLPHSPTTVHMKKQKPKTSEN